MSNSQHIILSLGALIGGGVLGWFAATTALENPVSTICIVLGLLFSVGGFVSLILALKKPRAGKEHAAKNGTAKKYPIPNAQ